MGDLLDDFRQEPVGKTGPKGTVAKLLSELSDDDRKDLLEALNDRTVQALVIAKVLTRRGNPVSCQMITKWRKLNGIAF